MRRMLLAAALALAAAPAFADVDLVAAWEAAQRQDPALAAARAEQDAGQARTRQARALSLPTVTVSGSVGYGTTTQGSSGAQFNAPAFGTVNGVDFRTEVNDGTATGWKISAEQPLYNQERRASARQLEIRADRADVGLHAARQELMLRTARAYFDVLQAGDALVEVRRQKEATARALEVAQASYDEGKLPITDRNEAQARFDGIVARESATQDAFELAGAAFFELTGIADAQLRRIPAASALAPFDAGRLDAWLTKTAERNPAIALAALGRDIAAQEVRKWDAQAAPTVSLVAQAGGDRIAGNSGFGGTGIASASSGVVGVQVAIPLYTGGMRGARGDEAVALAEKARLDVEAARKAAVLQTRGAWLGATGGLVRVAAYERAVASARTRLEATQTGHEVGARTTLDLLNAQADLFRALTELARAKYQVVLDRLALAFAAGELGEDALRGANANLAGE